MRWGKKLYQWFINLKLQNKLALAFMIIIIIPVAVIGTTYYHASMDATSAVAMKNVYAIVKQNNQIIDSELSIVEDASISMISDSQLFEEFSKADPNDRQALYKMKEKIDKIIYGYFWNQGNNYAAQLLTSYYTFGKSYLGIPYERFITNEMYTSRISFYGDMKWIPTYDYYSVINGTKVSSIKKKYVFSALRLINCSKINDSNVEYLDADIERPILVVNFTEQWLRNIFENSIDIKGAYYFVSDSDGYIITHKNSDLICTINNEEWLKEIYKDGSGTCFKKINGEKMIVCYDKSSVTGWLSVVVISPDDLLNTFVANMEYYTLYYELVLITLALVLVYVINRTITKPITKLVKAMEKMEQEDFTYRIPVKDTSEMGYLTKKFNNMNEKIYSLIEENYKVKIREKETQIIALNTQLNPHFLYNTLNIINWMAIENKQKDISKMLVKLSYMLQYTARNQDEMGSLETDLKWMRNYMEIMNMRFGERFQVFYEIDPELMEHKVPKLFLQPFVENSIIHGFEDMKGGGIIRIKGWHDLENIYFEVYDNGKGMEKELIQQIMDGTSSSIGIQNVDKRIKLIYGEAYGVSLFSKPLQGTRAIITIPASGQYNPPKSI